MELMSSVADEPEKYDVPETESIETCPLCGNGESEFLFWNVDRCYRLPGTFGLLKCAECGLVRLSPRPSVDQIGFYYPEDDYYSFQDPGAVQNRQIVGRLRDQIRELVLYHRFGYPLTHKSRFRDVLARIVSVMFFNQASYGLRERFPRYVKSGRALDIGCGNGTFLNLLKSNGWTVVGVDISPDAARAAKRKFDIGVFVGNVENAPFELESLDYIHMNHSIEHLPDPVETLKFASRLLKPGGKMYIETPNIGSDNFKKFQQYWMPLETPRHLFLFTPDSLRSALVGANLNVDKVATTYKSYYRVSYNYLREETAGKRLNRESDLPISYYFFCFVYNLCMRMRRFVSPMGGDFLHFWVSKNGEDV